MSNQKFIITPIGGKGAIGVHIQGIPAGFVFDVQSLKEVCPEYKILGGMVGDKCSGAPLTVLLPPPQETKLADIVSNEVIRPGTGDLGKYKQNGNAFYRENISNACVSPLLFAGELAKQILAQKKIHFLSHICRLGEVCEETFDTLGLNEAVQASINKGELPVADKRKEMLMKLCIAKAEKDTLGAQIECAVTGLPAGLGAPTADGIKSKLASALFALPDTSAVEFGIGIKAAEMIGSEYIDAPFADTTCGKIVTKTNHCGGIEGNMTNGMPLICKTTFAPSALIGKPQPSVHRAELRNVVLPPYENTVPCEPKTLCLLVEAALAVTIIDILK